MTVAPFDEEEVVVGAHAHRTERSSVTVSHCASHEAEQEEVPHCAQMEFRNVRSRPMTLLAITLWGFASITVPPRIVGKRSTSCGARVEYSLYPSHSPDNR